MANSLDFLKQLAGQNDEEENTTPLMLQNPAVVEANRIPSSLPSAPVQAPVVGNSPIDVHQRVNDALSSQIAPEYVAPQIAKPEVDPQVRKNQQAILDKLTGLDSEYKKNLQDAEDRKFKSELWATLGNYLPGVVAGATAMNTKAAVHAPNVPKITARDAVGEVNAKYKTDYEKLNDLYKSLKAGELTPKDELNRQTTNAYLKQGEFRQNSTNANQKTSAQLRGLGLENKSEKDSELSDKQIESLSGYDDTLTSLNRIREQKKKVDTGPLADKRNKLAAKLGMDDPEVTSLRSEVIDTLAAKIKALSGTAANESEVNRLKVTLPDINDSDEIFERKLKDAEKRIKEAKAIRENHYKTKQGKNVQGYGPQTSAPTSSTVRIQGPSGQVATVSAEAAQKYLSKPGYKKVD